MKKSRALFSDPFEGFYLPLWGTDRTWAVYYHRRCTQFSIVRSLRVEGHSTSAVPVLWNDTGRGGTVPTLQAGTTLWRVVPAFAGWRYANPDFAGWRRTWWVLGWRLLGLCGSVRYSLDVVPSFPGWWCDWLALLDLCGICVDWGVLS